VRVRAASVDWGTWHILARLPYPIRVAGFGLRKPKYLNPGGVSSWRRSMYATVHQPIWSRRSGRTRSVVRYKVRYRG
jgi:hypothetical protein